MTNKNFLLELADKIERLPTLFTEDEVKRLRQLSGYVARLENDNDIASRRVFNSFHRGDPGHPDNTMGM